MPDDPSSLAFTPRATGSVMGFPAHESRPGALGEVHARPHPMVQTPRILVQLSFMTEGGASVDHAVLSELSRRLGIAAPDRQARHHAMNWGQGSLRWERHTEFSTYLWEGPLSEDGPRQEEIAVRQRLFAARNGDFRHPPGNPEMVRRQRKADRGFRSDQPVPFGGGKRQGRDRHRFPPGRRRHDAHAGARPGADRCPHRRADPAPARHRDLSDTGHARPADGAGAFGAGAPHRGPPRPDHRRDEGRRRPATARSCWPT